MENQQLSQSFPEWLIPVIVILVIWDSIWKLVAMWRAGRNNHLAWYIALAVLNTVGILPIVYLLKHRAKPEA